jgi:hypothetical protein
MHTGKGENLCNHTKKKMTSEQLGLDEIKARILATEADISATKADIKAIKEQGGNAEAYVNLLTSQFNALNSQQLLLLEGNFSYFLYLIYLQLMIFFYILFKQLQTE